MRSRRLLCEEEVLEPAVEHLRRAARRLDVDHLELLGNRRRRQVQERRERAQQQVDLVVVDQSVVVVDDRVLVALVVLDHELDLSAEQAAVLVRQLRPDLVAALRGGSGLREVAGDRKRDADLDRTCGGPSGHLARYEERAGDRDRSKNPPAEHAHRSLTLLECEPLTRLVVLSCWRLPAPFRHDDASVIRRDPWAPRSARRACPGTPHRARRRRRDDRRQRSASGLDGRRPLRRLPRAARRSARRRESQPAAN